MKLSVSDALSKFVAKKDANFSLAGDVARDSRDWVRAEEAYTKHLQTNPADHAIWVQLGNCTKEQNKFLEADEAYQKALMLDPGNSDTHLQRGHLFKLRGMLDEAAESYATSYELKPTQGARRELDALGNHIDLSLVEHVLQAEATDVVYIELDDMLTYLEAHKTVSGIQRVQAEVVRHLVEAADSKDSAAFKFVVNPPYQECLWELRSEDVIDVVRYSSASKVDHSKLRSLVAKARSGAVAFKPQKGQTYLVLGAFWVFNTVSGRFLHLKRAGLKIGGFIHDLIPINQPEYCDPGLCHEFLLSFGDCMQVFDFFLANSEYTANEIVAYREKLQLPPVPVRAVQLAHANVKNGASLKREFWTPRIEHLKGRRFAMMVSTIEARKNHTFLVNAWRQFYNEGLNPPDLLFVGRFGWRVSDLMETLKQSDNFDGRLHILHDLSDGELETLYSACLFTVFPSFVEGWGLPVGESLAHHKPCVASSTSAVPEIGGDLVDYVDPLNLRDGLEVLRKMAFDDQYREERTKQIVQEFELRDWNQFSINLVSTVHDFRKMDFDQNPTQALFMPGVIFRPRDLSFGKRLTHDYPLSPMRLILAQAWGAVEHWGSWMLNDRGQLQFRTKLKPGTPVVVYLQLFGAPFAPPDAAVAISIGADDVGLSTLRKEARAIIPDGDLLVKAYGLTEANGVVTIALRVFGDVRLENANPGARRFSIGLKSISYAERNDVVSRTEIMEELIGGFA